MAAAIIWVYTAAYETSLYQFDFACGNLVHHATMFLTHDVVVEMSQFDIEISSKLYPSTTTTDLWSYHLYGCVYFYHEYYGKYQ